MPRSTSFRRSTAAVFTLLTASAGFAAQEHREAGAGPIAAFPDGALPGSLGAAQVWTAVDSATPARADADVVPGAPQLGAAGDALEFLSGTSEKYARGRTYKAWLDGDSFTYVPYFGSDAPRSWPLTMKIATAAVGGERLEIKGDSGPRRDGQRMSIARGDLVERYDFALESVEQSFAVRTGTLQGELVVELDLSTDLEIRRAAGETRFDCDEGHVRYSEAFAIHGSGARLPIETDVQGDRIRFTVPSWFVAEAAGELVIDPVLSTFDVDGFSGSDQGDPDVAYDLSSDTFTYIYEEIFSGADTDLYQTTVDTLGAVQSAGFVSLAPEDERVPAIANLGRSDLHLIVAERALADGFTEISGYTFNTQTFAASPVFTVGDTGSDSARWTNRRPDVGGNSSLDPSSRFCVVWEREFADGLTQARARIVAPDTTQLPFFGLATTGEPATAVVISESTGDPSVTNIWNACWLETPASGLRRIRGVGITATGALNAPSSTLHTLGVGQSLLTMDVSDTLSSGDGAGKFLIVFDESALNFTDMVGVVCEAGASVNEFNLQVLEHSPLSVDEDVIRVSTTREEFVVGYLSRPGGGPDYSATVTCYDITEDRFLAISERRTFLGTSLGRGANEVGDFACMASRFSGGFYGSRYVGVGWPTDLDGNGDLDIQGAVHFASRPYAPAFQFCDGTQNSTGDRGFMTMYGSRSATTAKEIQASALPPSQFALLISGDGNVISPGAGGSSGTLCVGGNIGRYNSQIRGVDAAGEVLFDVDPTAIPSGVGTISATAGQVYYWQVWHRDVNGGTVTSNFTNAVTILFN